MNGAATRRNVVARCCGAPDVHHHADQVVCCALPGGVRHMDGLVAVDLGEELSCDIGDRTSLLPLEGDDEE